MIKKAVLIAVLLVVMCFGTAMAAQIDSLASNGESGPAPTTVFVNPGGLGDALIYGYYNVRNNNETIFTVTNTDQSNGARVRIRFREAATLTQVDTTTLIPGCDNGSQEILDFDICLSPGDVWTGQITSDAAGAGLLKSTDTDTFVQTKNADCNVGGILNPAVIFPTQFPNGVEFKFPADLNITADQTREGYFEVIAERILSGPGTCSNVTGSTLPKCTCGDMLDVESDGDPLTCDVLASPSVGQSVDNVLMGHAYIVNLASSATFSYAATALANFALGDITHDLTVNAPNLCADSETAPSCGAVNYALTKSNVMSIYDVEAGVNGKTQLIVNFPTKWATHQDTFNSTSAKCDKSPNDIFDTPDVKVTLFDDAENTQKSACEFSPCPKGSIVTLPNEVNVVDINNSGIFTTDVKTSISTGTFDFGWITIDLVDAADVGTGVLHRTSCDGVTCTTDGTVLATLGAQTANGLPAIGYAVMDFAGSDFSGLIPLQYTSSVSRPD